MKTLFSVFFILASTYSLSFATKAPLQQGTTGLVEINGKQMYVEYTVAKDNKPTVVLVNGLTYSTRNWSGVSKPLIASGYGVVVFDMAGMGLTLLSNPVPTSAVLYSQQVLDIKTLLKKLKVPAPYNFAGLSYGGGIIASFAAHFPELTNNLIMIDPYTEFLETQKNWIKQQISDTRSMFPYNPSSDEELTDYFIRQLVYTTYPSAEITSLENPYKLEGITRMVQGIRMYQPIDDAKSLGSKKMHLVIALQDQYIPQDIYTKYWNAVPVKARANLTYVQYSEHKIPEAFPRFMYQYIKAVVDKQPLLYSGQVLLANPLTMKIEPKK